VESTRQANNEILELEMVLQLQREI